MAAKSLGRWEMTNGSVSRAAVELALREAVGNDEPISELI